MKIKHLKKISYRSSRVQVADDQGVKFLQRRSTLRHASRASLLGAGAYLSGQWSKPIINAIVLPSHAMTSMPEAEPDSCDLTGAWTIRDTRPGENDPGAPLELLADGTGTYDGAFSVTYTVVDQDITLDIEFTDSTANLAGTVSENCNVASGSWDNLTTGFQASWEAERVESANIASAVAERGFEAFR